jgi:hypothetical protein
MKRRRELSTPIPIRIVNTRTGRTTVARGGKDAANIIKIEQDRRSGLELSKEGGTA